MDFDTKNVDKMASNTKNIDITLNDLSNLPSDLILKIAFDLPPKTLISYCEINKKFSKVCSEDYLWNELYKRDFDDFDKIRPTIRQLYTFKIYQNKKLIGFLNEHITFNDYSYHKQKKMYKTALTLFKDFLYYFDQDIEEVGVINNIVDLIPEKIKRKYLNRYNIVYLILDYTYELKGLDIVDLEVEDDINEYVNDEDYLKKLISISNDINKTNYTFEETMSYI